MSDALRSLVLPRLERVRPAGGGAFVAACPVAGHGKGGGDRNPSLSIAPGDTQPVVFRCQAGCDQDDVKAALIGRGVDWAAVCLPGEPRSEQPDTWMPCGHERAAEYLYRDAGGTVRYGTARCSLKGHGCSGFAYWRPDPGSRSGRRWRLTEPDATGRRRMVAHLPYRLPEVLTAIAAGRTVWVVEGEKDADRLAQLGVAATCNDGGAGKWNTEYAAHLAGADVVVVADRDAPGWRHAEQVVATLLPVARSVEVVRAAVGKDASDHLDAGRSIGAFVNLATPLLAPTAVPGCPDCGAAA